MRAVSAPATIAYVTPPRTAATPRRSNDTAAGSESRIQSDPSRPNRMVPLVPVAHTERPSGDALTARNEAFVPVATRVAGPIGPTTIVSPSATRANHLKTAPWPL